MNQSQNNLSFFDLGDGRRLGYRLRPGSSPTLLFLPGYASDMAGTKAIALDDFAARRGLGLLRFDYSGTGSSDGKFDDGTLASWIDESLAMVDQLTDGPIIPIGSSMGAWIALHVALKRPSRVQALVAIAAAPDFTDWGFSDDQKSALREAGRIERSNPYGGNAQVTTRGFWESGQALRLLDGPISVDCPVRLVHGEADNAVPSTVAIKLMAKLRSADVQLNILKGGGHRLSEPHEIEAIVRAVAALLEPVT